MTEYKKIAALWKKKAKDGSTFLSGKMNEHTQLSLMANKFKKHPHQPDYYLYSSGVVPKSKNDSVAATQAHGDDL